MAPDDAQVIILDRDGVINDDSPSYIKSPDEWRPIEGSLEAIAMLCRAGYRVYVATNQAGVGRGYFDLDTLHAIHARMQAAIEAHGGEIGGIFYCPHHPDDHCGCRKPEPGLLLEIAEHAGVDIRRQLYVGDSPKDIEAAKSAGCKPVLVLTGHGRETVGTLSEAVDVYESLFDFASRITES